MKLFRSHKKDSNITDAAAGKIAGGIIGIQRHFDFRLSQLTKNWKRKQQWIFLNLVCLAFGGLSALAIIKPFRSTGVKTVMPKAISVPTTIKHENNILLITEEEFQKVQAYKRDHPDLKELRPSLLDSLNLIEQTYYSQKNR